MLRHRQPAFPLQPRQRDLKMHLALPGQDQFCRCPGCGPHAATGLPRTAGRGRRSGSPRPTAVRPGSPARTAAPALRASPPPALPPSVSRSPVRALAIRPSATTSPATAAFFGVIFLPSSVPHVANPVKPQRHAVVHLAGPDAGERHLAGLSGIDGLEHLRRVPCAPGSMPSRARRGRRPGRLVAQRLQQPVDAVLVFGRAEEHRHDQILLQVAGQRSVDFVGRRHHVLQQLFHQVVVEIGQRLQHLAAGSLLRRPSGARAG